MSYKIIPYDALVQTFAAYPEAVPARVLEGPNPVVEAIDAGHFIRVSTIELPKRKGEQQARGSVEFCRACNTPWPCAEITRAFEKLAQRTRRVTG